MNPKIHWQKGSNKNRSIIELCLDFDVYKLKQLLTVAGATLVVIKKAHSIGLFFAKAAVNSS